MSVKESPKPAVAGATMAAVSDAFHRYARFMPRAEQADFSTALVEIAKAAWEDMQVHVTVNRRK